jgi:hypothetical protein
MEQCRAVIKVVSLCFLQDVPPHLPSTNHVNAEQNRALSIVKKLGGEWRSGAEFAPQLYHTLHMEPPTTILDQA